MAETSAQAAMTYRGSCHCGCVEVRLHTARAPAALGARACRCSFCRLHGASWTSDPQGRLAVSIRGGVQRYRFGTGSAEFLICAACGVASAVTWRSEEALFGVVRVECLDDRDALRAHMSDAEFGAEDFEARMARRSRSWTPAVIDVTS